MSIKPPYSLLPLEDDQNSIRLLYIQGSSDENAPVVGSLRIAQLDEHPEYEALSWCWGKYDTTEDVLINDVRLPVSPNLISALRSLRLKNKTRVLWIDAICINQDLVAEKNFQVRLMKEVYASSTRTVVWLGPSDDQSRKAFQLMRKPPAEHYPNVVNAVLRRPWFRRVWVIQEVSFAPSVTVQCGEDSIEWQNIVRQCSRINRIRTVIDPDAPPGSKHFHPSFYPRVLDATRRRIREGGRLSIVEALRSFRSFDSTLGADKIYGVLGLLEDPSLVTVDYHTPVEELFRDVAVRTMLKSQRLDFLQESLPKETPKLQRLNSWVPDWTDKEQAVEQDVEYLTAKEVFRASCDKAIEHVVLGKEGNLQVSAQFIASIAELSNGLPNYRDIRERILPEGRRLPHKRGFDLISYLLAIPQSWESIACRINGVHGTLQDKYVTNEPMLEALYNTLYNRAPPFADFETARRFDKWMNLVEALQSAGRVWQRYIENSLPWILVWMVTGPCMAMTGVMVVFLVVTGRVVLEPPAPPVTASRSTWLLGRTDNGLLGLFPAPTFVAPKAMTSRNGDAVVILKGGSRPYVLRKERDSDDKWRLIGDAYVHGIMHGAAFDESKCVTIDLL